MGALIAVHVMALAPICEKWWEHLDIVAFLVLAILAMATLVLTAALPYLHAIFLPLSQQPHLCGQY